MTDIAAPSLKERLRLIPKGRLGRNVGLTVGGNLAAAGLGLVTLALNAHGLGAAAFGVFAIVISIAMLLDRTFAFQSWMPLINLGNPVLKSGDMRAVGHIVLSALIFDGIGAIATTLSAVALVLLFGDRVGIPRAELTAAAIYMSALITELSGAPIGLLRLLNRFAALSVIQTFGSAIGAMAALILWLSAAPLTAYLLVFAAVAAANNLLLLGAGLCVARKAGIVFDLRGFASSWRAARQEFWSASWSLALSSAINVLRERAPILLMGALLGATSVGLYHIADRIAGFLCTTIWAIHRAYYPEISQLANDNRYDTLRRLVLNTSAVSTAIAIGAVLTIFLAGHFVLGLIGGEAYLGAYWPLVLLIAAQGLTLIGMVGHATIVAVFDPRKLLKANALSFMAFAVALPFAILHAGLAGAAAAQVLFFALWVLALFLELWAPLARRAEAS